jgi:hypothetical protein
VGDCQGGVFVVGVYSLLDLGVLVSNVGKRGLGESTYFPLISLVGSWAVVGQGFWTGEFMVGRGGGDYIALRGDLAGEARYRAGHLGAVRDGLWFFLLGRW